MTWAVLVDRCGRMTAWDMSKRKEEEQNWRSEI